MHSKARIPQSRCLCEQSSLIDRSEVSSGAGRPFRVCCITGGGEAGAVSGNPVIEVEVEYDEGRATAT